MVSDLGMAFPKERDLDLFQELVSSVEASVHHELRGEAEIMFGSLFFEPSSESSLEGARVIWVRNYQLSGKNN